MIQQLQSNETPLEDRLFRNILRLGMVAIFLLMAYDGFFTKDYHSVVIELVAAIVFLFFLVKFSKHEIEKHYKYAFSFILLLFVNIGWITGSGINLLNVVLYFTCVAIILIIHDKEIYPYLTIFVVVDLVSLFLLQRYTDIWQNREFVTENRLLLNYYIVTLFFVLVAGYLILFLKLNYQKERLRLSGLNQLLENKSVEISYQNEELKMSKDMLDSMVEKLEEQTKELMDIKGHLEEKVNSRTADLMKLNDRLLSQNQQLEQYAYITSHNLRAPIAQIKGLIQLLPSGNGFDKMTKETIGRISDSAHNLEKVFDDLSQILKVEKSMQQPWQQVDLYSEISSVVKSLKTSIAQKNIKMMMPGQQDVVIKALRPYVYSIFHNIIENAVKYSDAGKDEPYVKIEFGESANYLIVTITDNGIGIDMEHASGKIFQMYQRFNNTHPGQGFGLFLVKSQMDAMEGKVELESILGQGTTFNLYFKKR